MIERIVIENFKSLRKVDLKLGRMNLFIGSNASGKSNFFDALRIRFSSFCIRAVSALVLLSSFSRHWIAK